MVVATSPSSVRQRRWTPRHAVAATARATPSPIAPTPARRRPGARGHRPAPRSRRRATRRRRPRRTVAYRRRAASNRAASRWRAGSPSAATTSDRRAARPATAARRAAARRRRTRHARPASTTTNRPTQRTRHRAVASTQAECQRRAAISRPAWLSHRDRTTTPGWRRCAPERRRRGQSDRHQLADDEGAVLVDAEAAGGVIAVVAPDEQPVLGQRAREQRALGLDVRAGSRS